MLNAESFVWHLQGKLNVKALSHTVKGLTLSKDITVRGMEYSHSLASHASLLFTHSLTHPSFFSLIYLTTATNSFQWPEQHQDREVLPAWR